MIWKPIAVFWSCIFWLVTGLLPASPDAAEVADNPLRPADISSPAATLDTFMTEMPESIRAYARGDVADMRLHAERVFQTFGIELQPTQTGFLQGSEIALDLFEVLMRLELPPQAAIPGGAPDAADGDEPEVLPGYWTVPGTEIRIEMQVDEAEQPVGYRFSEETLLRVDEFRRRAAALPVQPEYREFEGIAHRFRVRPGLDAPAVVVATVQALPVVAFDTVWGEPLWKWATLLLGLGLAGLIFFAGYRLAGLLEGGSERRPERAVWARPLMLLSLIVAVGFMDYVVVDVIRLTGLQLAVATGLLAVIGHATAIWLIFLITRRAADAVITVRGMGVQSLDTQLVILVAKVIAVLLSLWVLIHLGDTLSIPVAPMIAGLGVGGLAVALAVRPTLENAVAGFVLFADKPVRVGEFCAFGDKLGTVEQIGLRSVQIRGLDRTVISVPNAEFSQMQITNFSRRDSNLFHTTLGLRYETSSDQLRLVLARLRELLIRHPMVGMDPARVRFSGYGDFSLNVEIFAFVHTRDWGEFLAVQEDLNLRIKDIVEGAGSGFAFPSQTLYMERGTGLDAEAKAKAETLIERWRDEDRLPFPDHETGYRFELANTLDYPPEGSPDSRRERPLWPAAE